MQVDKHAERVVEIPWALMQLLQKGVVLGSWSATYVVAVSAPNVVWPQLEGFTTAQVHTFTSGGTTAQIASIKSANPKVSCWQPRP